MPLYFAYGSNMHPDVMAERCRGAKAVGSARLPGWRFHITKRGSASIIPAAEASVFGVLWRCLPAHIHLLDGYEGVAWGNYRRRRLVVDTAARTHIPAFTYVNSRHYPGRARVSYMATAILPGAEAFDLPQAYIDELRAWLPDRPIGETRNRYRGSRKLVRFPRS
ncbi:MAG: gamma-glutamylcyclotransferase [Hyphomicrobiales bacterium]|nr:gamma-glutamylcyclotransferase [Hyphomicrobiales bacterium]